MEVWDAIRARRNVREYREDPIPADHLDRVLEAARRSPSAMNTQPWDLVVVTERQALADLAQVGRSAGHVARSQASIAVVAQTGETERRAAMIQYDLGQMTMQLMIAAADLGIGTAHAAVDDQELARRLLGFPDDRVLAWLIALGYPAGAPLGPLTTPKRRPFDEVVHRERW